MSQSGEVPYRRRQGLLEVDVNVRQRAGIPGASNQGKRCPGNQQLLHTRVVELDLHQDHPVHQPAGREFSRLPGVVAERPEHQIVAQFPGRSRCTGEKLHHRSAEGVLQRGKQQGDNARPLTGQCTPDYVAPESELLHRCLDLGPRGGGDRLGVVDGEGHRGNRHVGVARNVLHGGHRNHPLGSGRRWSHEHSSSHLLQ